MGKISVRGGGGGAVERDTGSPQNQWGNNGVAAYLHSQILRIREEDSLIGEDTVDVLSKYFCCTNTIDDHKHRRETPASPLRETTAN